MNHDAVTCPLTIWTGDPKSDLYLKWWIVKYSGEACRRRVTPHLHARFFQRILGRQTTTITFVHRNRVWHNPDEGWTLYVDRRGPDFHVRTGMSAQEAWDAFVKFQDRVDAWFKANPA